MPEQEFPQWYGIWQVHFPLSFEQAPWPSHALDEVDG